MHIVENYFVNLIAPHQKDLNTIIRIILFDSSRPFICFVIFVRVQLKCILRHFATPNEHVPIGVREV